MGLGCRSILVLVSLGKGLVVGADALIGLGHASARSGEADCDG